MAYCVSLMVWPVLAVADADADRSIVVGREIKSVRTCELDDDWKADYAWLIDLRRTVDGSIANGRMRLLQRDTTKSRAVD